MASLNKQALLRYRIIDELISRANYPSMQDIIEECRERIGKEFSPETLQKDIEAMKNDLSLGYEAPIKYNRTYKGYEYTDKQYSINTTNLNNAEKEQIKVASEILFQFKEAKLGESLKTTLQKLKILTNSPELLYRNRIIDFENSNFEKYDLLQQLYKSIKNRRKISLIYYCNIDNDISSHTVFPLLLKEYRSNWFLIIENIYHEPVALNLNYIFDVVELETMTPPKNIIDFDKYLDHSVGVEIDSEYLEEVEIRYKAEIANEIKNNPLHKSQQIIEEYPNGDLLVRYNLYITDELISEILKYGSKAFVSKNELVQQMVFDEIIANIGDYRQYIKY